MPPFSEASSLHDCFVRQILPSWQEWMCCILFLICLFVSFRAPKQNVFFAVLSCCFCRTRKSDVFWVCVVPVTECWFAGNGAFRRQICFVALKVWNYTYNCMRRQDMQSFHVEFRQKSQPLFKDRNQLQNKLNTVGRSPTPFPNTHAVSALMMWSWYGHPHRNTVLSF